MKHPVTRELQRMEKENGVSLMNSVSTSSEHVIDFSPEGFHFNDDEAVFIVPHRCGGGW